MAQIVIVEAKLKLDPEQFEKYTDFLSWLKKDKDSKNQKHD